MAKVARASLTETDAHAALAALIETHGSQTAVAKRLGLSVPYINDLIHGRRLFSDAMLEKLGMRRIVVKR